MKKFLFIGMPGSGKGTQARLLEQRGFYPISTGEIIKKAISKKDPLLTPYKESMDSGHLLPDDLIFRLLEKEIESLDSSYRGYILDGAVRNMNQLKYSLSKKLFEKVFFFKLIGEDSKKRINLRKTCPVCHATYINEKICKKCDVPLIVRKEDNQTSLGVRLKDYNEQTAPVVEYLEKNFPSFVVINASKTIEEVRDQVEKNL